MLFPKGSDAPVGVNQSTADSPLICQPERLIRGPPSLTRLQLAFHGSSPVVLESVGQDVLSPIESPLPTSRSFRSQLSESQHTNNNSVAGSVCDETRADEQRRLEQDLHLMRVTASVEWKDLSCAIPREHWKRDNEVSACEHVSCKVAFGIAVGPMSLPRLGWGSANTSRASIDIARPSISSVTRRMRTTSTSSSRSSLLSVLGGAATDTCPPLPPASPETTQFDIDEVATSPSTSTFSWLPEVRRRHHCRRCGAVVCADHSRSIVTLILEDTIARPTNLHSLDSTAPSSASECIATPSEAGKSPLLHQAPQECFYSQRYSIDELLPSALPTVIETPSSKTAKQPKSLQEQQRQAPLQPSKQDNLTSEIVLVSSPESTSNETWTTEDSACDNNANTADSRDRLDVIQEEGKTAQPYGAKRITPAPLTRSVCSPPTARPSRTTSESSWLSRAMSFVSLTPLSHQPSVAASAAPNDSLNEEAIEPSPSVAPRSAPRTLADLGAIAMRQEADGQIGIRARVCPLCARAVERARERALTSLFETQAGTRCASAPLGSASVAGTTSVADSVYGSMVDDEMGTVFAALYTAPSVSEAAQEQDDVQRLEAAKEFALSQARIEAERKREEQRQAAAVQQAERGRRLSRRLTTRRSHSLDGSEDSEEEEQVMPSRSSLTQYSPRSSVEFSRTHAPYGSGGPSLTNSFAVLSPRRAVLRHTHTAPTSCSGSPDGLPKGARLTSIFASHAFERHTASASRSSKRHPRAL